MGVRTVLQKFLLGVAFGATSLFVFIVLTSPLSAEQRTETVFAYATLTNPLIRTFACWCLTDARPATLAGWHRTGRTLVASATARTNGVRFTVSPTELARLDRYEGVPKEYTRIVQPIGSTSAWVYISSN